MGSDHARDPFGLNSFLMSPFDSAWEFSHSIPEEAPKKTERPAKSMSRRSSSSNLLRRPSPLAQPPVLADADADAEAKADDSTEVIDDEDSAVASDVAEDNSPRRPNSMGSKGLRALIARKSTLVTEASAAPVVTVSAADDLEPNSGPAICESPISSAPQSPIIDNVSRMAGSRSDSMCSAMSSGSSTDGSCDDGIQTPGDLPPPGPVDVSAASVRLVAALNEDRSRPKSTWRDWLNGRRSSFLGIRSESGTTLLESPRESVLDLGPEIPEAENSPTDNSDAAHAAAQLRRLSLQKLGALRMPSPHPLQLLLTRQHVNLPDEVAFSIPATKRVFPMSVNTVQRGSTEFAAAHGSLRVALAVRNVVVHIDRGERPTDAWVPKKASSSSNILRPRGVRDFVARQPFEERMVTFFPDERVTHVSMARRGFAIYELEFSDYIMALSESEDAPITWSLSKKSNRSTSSSSLLPPPRAAPTKVTKVDVLADQKRARRASRELVDKRRSMAPPQLPDIKRQSVMSIAPIAAAAPAKSSFRATKPKAAATWDDSSDEEDDAEASKPSATRPGRPPAARTQSAPVARARQSVMMDSDAALDHIARARERRAQFEAGECERKAESKRMSVMPSARGFASGKPPAAKDAPLSSRASSRSLAAAKAERPQPTRKASSSTLAGMAGEQTPRKQRTPTSLPSSPRSGLQPDRRRVVSQYEMAAASMQPRASMMGMAGMYGAGVPQVPLIPAMPVMPAYSPAVMHRGSMAFPPAMPTMTPMMGMNGMNGMQYHPQFAGMHSPQFAGMHSPQLPQMYLPPPIPGTGRRRERPVS
ncbi:uncharacterized protein EHS24_007499 [Apiotrichum porosum]|uniref:Uncharacterized protein n=1 Tax=Apiotrichum porosum TaxID=105984 RepID=A0A427XUJ5_9TREE|nr:uncharacterized protein EHS24_007499 [Apiotrichum porosum]RSH82519.1 hypothetical protein EHS24_007499 [Apiotrichum porosum]